MGQTRLFLTHDALEAWLSDGTAGLEGDEVVETATARRFAMTPAVHVLAEIGGAPDALDLVGRVKTVAALLALGAEVAHGSVIAGDAAYEVEDGVELRGLVKPEDQSDRDLIAKLLREGAS